MNRSTTIQSRLTVSAGKGARAALRAIVTSTVLAAVKILTGLVGHSYALIADGVESILDILSSLAVWGSLKISASPPNERYPYGYGRVESLTAVVVALALLVAALGLALQCVREILTPHHAPAPFTLVVLVGVVVTKEVLYRRLLRTGAEIGSTALANDAWHHRADSLTSLAAFVGISIALLGGEGYETADDWAALLACAIIAYNGVSLLRSSFREVMDAAPPSEVESRIREVAAGTPDVAEIDKCRVRKSGLSLFVDIHVVVDGEISVRRGHEVAHRVKDALLESELGIQDVLVHIEPESDPDVA